MCLTRASWPSRLRCVVEIWYPNQGSMQNCNRHWHFCDSFCNVVHRRKAQRWVYPKNVPMRQYQADIVETAIFHNTLVCLPTGLGKTLIGAVVMYNYYSWFSQGKVVFIAPTKPLVDQQREACLFKVSIAEVREV